MKKLYILTAIGICMAFAGCSEYSAPSDVNGTGESITGITTTAPNSDGTSDFSDGTSVVNSTTTIDTNIMPESTQTYIVYTDENGLVIGTVNENTPEEEKLTQPEGVSGSYAVIIDENGVVIGTSNGSVSPDVSGSDNPQGSTPVDTTTPTGTTTAPNNGGSGNGNGNSDSQSSASQTTTAFVEITPKTMYASVSATLKSSTSSDAITLGTITKGSAVSVIGESGSYYVVKYNGITAFVSKSSISASKPQSETTTTTTKNTTPKDTTTTTTTKKSSATTTTTKPTTTTKKTTTVGTTSKSTTTVGTTTKATTTTKKTTTTAKTTTTTKKTTTTTKKATTTTTTTKKTTTTTTTTKKPTTTTTTTTTSSGVKLPYDATTNAFINEVLRLTNEFRAENGVAPLELDLDLTAVAMVRVEEIEQLFDHTRPDGTSCKTAFTEGGFILGDNIGAYGENIAYGYKSAAAVVEAWKNSTGHRANMLNAKFDTIGIGFVNIDGVYYWTQEFVYLW